MKWNKKRYIGSFATCFLLAFFIWICCPTDIQAKVINLNVRNFGAKGNDKKDDNAGIQYALDRALKSPNNQYIVTIPEGTYYIHNSLIVYSNTTLKLTPKTKIMRGPRNKTDAPMLYVGHRSKSKTGGYNQRKNISIIGGIWEGNPKNKYSDASVMRFRHCKDILIKDCVIQNYSAKHAVVFAGVKRGTISGVIFRNQVLVPGCYLSTCPQKVWRNAEAIHTDTTNVAGEPDAYPLDGTICDDIVIKNCTFVNMFAGLGSHVLSEKSSANYKVVNNVFKNVKVNCINIFSRRNVEIWNNRWKNCGNFVRDQEATYRRLEKPRKY